MKKNKPIQLSIPQPCSEDWSKMTPQEQGRFCDACQKCVVDFTNFNDHQLYDYIQAHQEEKICGHFRNTQLNRTLQLPPQPHSRLYRIAIAVGLTLAIVSTAEVYSFAKAPMIEYSFLYKPHDEINAVVLNDATIIKGKVIDSHGEPAINATVQLIYNGNTIKGSTVTDYNGNYIIKGIIGSGTYTLKTSYIGDETNYNTFTIRSNETYTIDIKMKKSEHALLGELTIREYDIPLINRDNPSPMNKTIRSDEIEKMPY